LNEETFPFRWLRIQVGATQCLFEPRFFFILMLIFPLYTLAAFVGNDWGYMLPCTLFAALLLGMLLPFIEVVSIACTCSVPPSLPTILQREIVLRAKRLPFFGVLSNLIPSGYLNARLHLMRRVWAGTEMIPAVVPLPVVLESLSRGVDVRLVVPSLPRGIYEPDSLELASCFPFALAWWSRRVPLEKNREDDANSVSFDSTITVLPDLLEITGNFHSRLSSSKTNASRPNRNVLPQQRSATLKGLREFTERDSLSQIHWASSARSGKFLVREFELENLPEYDVTLDLMQNWNEKQLDLACSAAYSLIHYGYKLGFTPQLSINPPISWESVAEQLADIPSGCAGEELCAEILARLSPMSSTLREEYTKFQEEQKRNALDICAENSARVVLALRPQEVLSKQSAGIMLVELSEYNLAPQASTQILAQLENEAELRRL
jgi:uncharacterized protein (DUF58 family)